MSRLTESLDLSGRVVLVTGGSLGAQRRPSLSGAEQAALAALTAVDGRLLPALPRMVWAVWQDDQHRAAKMHVACAVLRHGPVDVTVTAGNARSERSCGAWSSPGGSTSLIGAIQTMTYFKSCMTCRAASLAV